MTGEADPPADAKRGAPTRRHVILGGIAGLGAGAAGGYLARGPLASASPDLRPSPPPTGAAGQSVAVQGEHQPGVARPAVRQAQSLMAVGQLTILDDVRGSGEGSALEGDSTTARTALATAFRTAGDRIRALCEGAGDVAVTPDGPGDLTVTLGVGRLPLSLSADPSLATLVELPRFRDDQRIAPDHLGGEVYISVNGGDPGVLDAVMREVAAALGGVATSWSQFGVRGIAQEPDGASRNPFHFYDGLAVPRTQPELETNVWITEGPLAGGTVCVIRRFSLDTEQFAQLDGEKQNAIMGRDRATGAPLSGGERLDDVNLLAKDPTGEYLTPARSHARAAHPSFTGSALMLRRSYNFVDGAGQSGHVFVSFARDADAFARTLVRMEEMDALMPFMHANAGGAFAILPGQSGSRPLGATLF